MALAAALTLLGSVVLGGSTRIPEYHGARFGDLIVGDAASRAGRRAFLQDRRAAIDGKFNATNCGDCHRAPALGGGTSSRALFVIKQNYEGEAATFQRFVSRHGTAIARHPHGRYYLRKPPALFGSGLLEAIPDSELVSIAQLEARQTPQHRGRPARLLDGTIGRFGWKADVATLPKFVNSAFLLEMGLSRSTDSAEVISIAAYVRDLAAPPPAAPHNVAGKKVFDAIGCADCHRPALRIGPFASAPPLSGSLIEPYTDLLLHDMGARGAELHDNAAGPRDFRTPPLWGVASTGPPYMHDGSARSLADAIMRHGGEAADSARAFSGLDPAHRNALVGFVRSL